MFIWALICSGLSVINIPFRLFVCIKIKYIVYAKIIKANSFINKDVLNKLLNGLIMNNITIIIDVKEQRQIVLVWSLYPEI